VLRALVLSVTGETLRQQDELVMSDRSFKVWRRAPG
jgi:hypothetical protein